MRTIRAIDVFPIQLPVLATFKFSSGSAGQAGDLVPVVLVRITDSEGTSGWGESRPMPAWSYETAQTVTTTIRSYLAPVLLGMEITDRYECQRRMQKVIGIGPSTGQPLAKAAVDMALHDLCARAVGLPLRCYLGGSVERNTVALSYTVIAPDIADVEPVVHEALQQGYRHFNFKAAVNEKTDIAVAQALRKSAGPDAFIWADANQGYQRHQVLRIAEAFAHAGVDVLEQPLPADQLYLMQEVRSHCSLPLAVDEASVSPADFFQYAARNLVDYLVIKLARSGGIWPTLQQIATAQAAGLPLLVSGLTETLLSRMASCQVATAAGFTGPAALNGRQFLDDSALYPERDRYEYQGAVHLPETPGIGVTIDEARLEPLVIKNI